MPLQVWVSVPQLPQDTGWVWPGPHTPVQAPDTHVWLLHVAGLPQLPVPSQVSTPFAEHCLEPGEHEPLHVPAPVQTYMHAEPEFCHAPVPSHFWGWLPLHCIALGVQAEQVPALQTVLQAEPWFTHVPVESHFWGCRPLHCSEPGEHVPAQTPLVQTLVQAAPDCQVPVVSQVCGVSPLHSLLPGVQLPEQVAAVQTYWHADPRSPHWPLELHTWGCRPLQRMSPPVQPASASPASWIVPVSAGAVSWPVSFDTCVSPRESATESPPESVSPPPSATTTSPPASAAASESDRPLSTPSRAPQPAEMAEDARKNDATAKRRKRPRAILRWYHSAGARGTFGRVQGPSLLQQSIEAYM